MNKDLTKKTNGCRTVEGSALSEEYALSDEQLSEVVGGTDWNVIVDFLKKNASQDPCVARIIMSYKTGNISAVIKGFANLSVSNPSLHQAAIEYDKSH